jgi:hypothetical protein
MKVKSFVPIASGSLLSLALLVFSSFQANRTNAPQGVVYEIEVNVGEPVTVSGDLSKGEIMEDLSWAAYGSVACFPGTRFVEFQGNQVFYSVYIPQGAELKATVTPKGEKKHRINLYGYIDYDGTLPPLSSCRSCEAGYELYAGKPNMMKPGKPQSISFGQAVRKDFVALIAVSGAKGVIEGEYDLTVELSPM